MISIFLKHELKAFWRAKNAGKSLAVQIILGVFILYFLCCALFLGFFMDEGLKHFSPKVDVVVSFCGIILLYYLWDLLMRIQLQELPTLRVQPYLQLPVKRNALAQYLGLTALLSGFNIIPLLLFVPFIFKVIAAQSGGGIALAFLFSILGFTIFNNYLALYIKRKANVNGWLLLIATGVLALFVLGDFMWHIYSIRNISYLFFGHLISSPILVLLPLLLAVGMYYFNFLYIKQNFYLEELSSKKNAYKGSTEYPILNRFGIVGDLVANEIKLILRNKRPSSALKMSFIFLVYGLIFYLNPAFKMSDGIVVFVGMFMSGVFIINYGQFMYGWQASHFDGLLVSKLNISDFIKSKYLLFTIMSTAAFVLLTPYVYFGWRVLLIHTVMFLWNIGINTTIILFFANRNNRRISLTKGAAFNWQGVGASQWLVGLPIMFTPLVIFIPFKLFNQPNIGLAVMAGIAIICLFARGFFVKKLEADFYNRKFKIAEGFREK
jgi:hypothetical protein